MHMLHRYTVAYAGLVQGGRTQEGRVYNIVMMLFMYSSSPYFSDGIINLNHVHSLAVRT